MCCTFGALMADEDSDILIEESEIFIEDSDILN